MRHSRGSRFLFQLGGLALAALALPICAWATCTLTSCEATFPATCMEASSVPYSLTWTGNGSGCADLGVRIDFGDGTNTDHAEGTHYYWTAGTYHWTATVYSEYPEGCTEEGDIVITKCQLACAVTATPVRMEASSVTVSFQATVTETGCECGPATVYQWNFLCNGYTCGTGDGPTPTFTFTGAAPYTWYLKALKNNFSFCENSGAVGAGCLSVKNLKLCADEITKDPNVELFTLKKNVKVGGALLLDSDATFEGIPSSGVGVLRTDGKMQVRLKDRTQTVLKGPGLVFDVDGNVAEAYGTLTPQVSGSQYLSAFPFPLALTMVEGKPVTLTDKGAKIEPTVFLGGAGYVLASFKCSLFFPTGGATQLLGFEVINGRMANLNFFQMTGEYDYDKNEGRFATELGFPFADQWGISFALMTKPGCVDAGETKLSFPIGIPLLPTPMTLEAAGGKFGSLCEPSKFFLWFGGDIGIDGIPDEIIGLQDLGLGIRLPYYAIIDAGTCKLLGYPLGGLGGRLSMKPGYYGVNIKGWVSLADLVTGHVAGLVNVNRRVVIGSVTGSIRIPDFTCDWSNLSCRAVRRALTSVVTLPVEFQNTTMNLYVAQTDTGWKGTFRGILEVAGFPLAVMVEYDHTDFELLAGTNFENMFQVTERAPSPSPESAERSVSFVEEKRQVLFAAGSNSPSGPLPAIALRNPQGQMITPANVGSFPGVHYADDSGDKIALFRLETASAGNWTLTVSNLAESEVTLGALVPRAAPATAFRSVVQNGNQVAIQAGVSPASEKTKVGFYYSQDSADATGFPVGDEVPATTGTVSASWDTTGLAPGKYFLFAKTDDGLNPPVVTYCATQVTVGTSSLAPPTNLTGSRSGSTATLSWTPSTSPAVRWYNVLYTDAPDMEGYPFLASAALPNGAVIEGLDAAKQYRFVVAGYDESQNFTPESASWFTGSAPPADVRTLVNRVPVSDSVGAGAWKYYKVAAPDSPESLKVTTGGASGDVDLYLKFGAKPTLASYDYKADAAGGNESLAVVPTSQPVPLKKGDWYIGVYGKQAATCSLVASVSLLNPCTITCTATVAASAAPGTSVPFAATSAPQHCSESVSYLWDFGDGSSQSSEQNPSHTYTAEGNYTWVMAARSGDTGCVKWGVIAIGTAPPCTLSCEATVPASAITGIAAAFQASATATNCSGPPVLSWAFGDGATSVQQNPAHVYSAPGTYTWTLTVTVSGTQACTRQGTIAVTSICTLTCSASAAPPSGSQSLDVAFSAAATPVNCSAAEAYAISSPPGPDPLGGAVILKSLRRGAPEESDGKPVPRSFGRNASMFPQDDGLVEGPKPALDEGAERSETATLLTSGVPVSGNLAVGGWASYVIPVPAGATQLSVQTSGASVDMDLYIRFGSEPDLENWDYRPYTYSGNEIVVVTALSAPRPIQAGNWYIGVHAASGGGSFTISATVGNGGSGVTLLTSGVPVNGTVAYDPGYKLYSVEVPAGATQLVVATTNATDDVDLYVRYGNVPDPDHWDYRPYTYSGNESVTVTPASSPRPLTAGTWFFVVSGLCPQGCPFTIAATVTGGATCTLACTATVPASGAAGTAVAFASTATPSNCSGSPGYLWDFGDGQTSTQQDPSHTYTASGTYTWVLTVSVPGATCVKSGSISVAASNSTAYAWTFGDGGSSTLQNPTHTYPSAGVYSWTMTATWSGKTCSQGGTVRPGIPSVPGDCDGNGAVSIGEVQKAINMFLGTLAPGCGVDCNANAAVSIGEVQKVINAFLGLAASC